MNMRMIHDISNFIFIEDTLEKAEVLLIPGGSFPELPEKAATLWENGLAKYIVPSGGVSVKTGKFNGVKSKNEIYNLDYQTECQFYTDVLMKAGVSEKAIIPEDKSGCTADNARFTRLVLDEQNIHPKNAIICCKAFHARRCLMFYQFYLPETQLIIAPVSDLHGYEVNRDNWYKTDMGLSCVLGELTRLGTQFIPEFVKFKDSFQK